MLSGFLERAANEPAYRPDSQLTERGPVSSSTNTQSDLTLHHLHRIQLGLQGRRLGPDPDAATGEEGIFAAKKKRKRDLHPASSNSGPPDSSSAPTSSGPQTPPPRDISPGRRTPRDWQEKSVYEEAQDDSDVDVNNAQRDPGAGVVGGGRRGQSSAAAADMNGQEEDELMEEIDLDGRPLGVREEHAAEIPQATVRQTKTTPKKIIRSKADEISATTPTTVDREERKRRKKERRKRDKAERAQARADGAP